MSGSKRYAVTLDVTISPDLTFRVFDMAVEDYEPFATRRVSHDGLIAACQDAYAAIEAAFNAPSGPRMNEWTALREAQDKLTLAYAAAKRSV